MTSRIASEFTLSANSDADLGDALNQLSCRLGAASDTLHTAAALVPQDQNAGLVWSAIYLVEQAVAMTDALTWQVEQGERPTATPRPEVGTTEVSVRLTGNELEQLRAVSAARYGGDAEWCASELLRQGLGEIVEGAHV